MEWILFDIPFFRTIHKFKWIAFYPTLLNQFGRVGTLDFGVGHRDSGLRVPLVEPFTPNLMCSLVYTTSTLGRTRVTYSWRIFTYYINYTCYNYIKAIYPHHQRLCLFLGVILTALTLCRWKKILARVSTIFARASIHEKCLISTGWKWNYSLLEEKN